MSFRAVFFDLDGTLLNTLPDLTFITNTTIGEAGFPPRTQEEIETFVGYGLPHLLNCALPEEAQDDPAFLKKWLPRMRANYMKYQNERALGYPGVPELLKALHAHGVKNVIVTNKIDPAAKEVAEHFFPGLIDVVVGSRDDIRLKPWPDQGEAALKELGFSARECIYVGDSETDVETGQNLGRLTLSVTWGFRRRETLIEAGAMHLIDTPEEILDYVLYTE